MSKEIRFRNKNYAANFVIDNAPDCDICQLFITDEKNSKFVQISTWLRSDFFLAYMKETENMISYLKNKIKVLEKQIIKG